MSVRQSLLAILDQGPCYGYQLRAEYERRTGGTWPLNVGQIYSTLDRLERDGLVVKGASDAQGHVYYEITDAGSADVAAWLRAPLARASGARDELALRIALAATLPGVDAGEVVRAQRDASAARLDRLRITRDLELGRRDAAGLAAALVAESLVSGAEAELAWLERAAQLLAQHPEHDLPLAPAADQPKRGRPARAS